MTLSTDAHFRWWFLAAGLLLAALIAGCSAPGAAPTDTGTAMPDDPQGVVLPTNLPIPTVTLVSGGADSEPVLTSEYGLPNRLTGYEIIAANAGEATYSGYACVISPIGCPCEEAIVEHIAFDFVNNDQMIFTFSGEGYRTSWDMVRIGPSQWSYTQNYIIEGTEMQIAHSVWITFTEFGFTRNELGHLPDGSVVTCPDNHFRRMPTPTLEPTAVP